MEGKPEIVRNVEELSNEEPKKELSTQQETDDLSKRKSATPQKIIVPEIFESPTTISKRKAMFEPNSPVVEKEGAESKPLTSSQSADNKQTVPRLRLDLLQSNSSDDIPSTSNKPITRTDSTDKPKSLVKTLISKFTQAEPTNAKPVTPIKIVKKPPQPQKENNSKQQEKKAEKADTDNLLSPRNRSFVKSLSKVAAFPGKLLNSEPKPLETPRGADPPMTPRGTEPMTPRRRVIRKQPTFLTSDPITPENATKFKEQLEKEEHRLKLYEQQLIKFEQELMKRSRELEEQKKIFALQQHSFHERKLNIKISPSNVSLIKEINQDMVMLNNKLYNVNLIKTLQQYLRSKILRQKWMSLIHLVKDHSSTLFVRLRHETLKEIVTTEKTHVQGLEIVKKCFLDPIREAKLLPDDVIRSIFLNIEEVLEFNSSLLAQLQERISSSDGKMMVGDIFIEKASSMQMYEYFITNLDSSIHTLIKVRKNPEIDEWFQRAKDLSGRGLSLEDYMIYPVQRLPRYEMLLAGLKKYTIEDNIDYKNLCIALDRIKGLNDNINEMKAVQDSETKINYLQQNLIQEEPLELKREGRVYLREGILTLDTKKCFCILFTDILIITTKKKSGLLKLQGIIDMSTVSVLEPDDMKDITAFQLISQTTDKIAYFSAPTVNEKTQWIQTIGDSITESINYRQSLKMKNRRESMNLPESSEVNDHLLDETIHENSAKQDLIASYVILKEQVVLKNRKGVLFTEKNCFIATEAIDCLVRYLFVDRVIARCMCEDLRILGYIKPVTDKKTFADSGTVYYKFVK